MAYRDDKFYWTKEDLAPFQLEEELQVWRDLELVALKRKWYSEDHVNLKTDVNFYSDASNHGCGGVLFDEKDENCIFKETFFAFDEELQHQPIHVKEAFGVYATLSAARDKVKNKRVTMWVDNQVTDFFKKLLILKT